MEVDAKIVESATLEESVRNIVIAAEKKIVTQLMENVEKDVKKISAENIAKHAIMVTMGKHVRRNVHPDAKVNDVTKMDPVSLAVNPSTEA